MAVEKRVATYGLAADGAATPSTSTATRWPRRPARPGGAAALAGRGHVRARHGSASLAELVPLVGRRDQTMTHFGFARGELLELARALAGRGVDRMVPFGERAELPPGLGRQWTSPAEFTRLVTVFA